MNKLSITGTFEKKAELEAQAKKVWTDLAEQLLTLIPDNLEALSSELGFSKIKAPSLEVKITDEMWRFPEWLEYLVTNTKSSPYGCCDNKVKQDQLLDYDCASFDDLKAKLDILQGVWKSLVRIEVDEDELPWLVTIRFYAAEITHQLISDNND